MKTLLIPTDFKTETLNCIPDLLKKVYPDMLNIIFVHTLDITDSIQELLMLSKRSSEYQLVPKEFFTGCHQMKQVYPGRIANVRVEFFYGSTVALFRNHLEANFVDGIVMLKNYKYQPVTDDSIDPRLLVSRSKAHVIEVEHSPAVIYHMPATVKKLAGKVA